MSLSVESADKAKILSILLEKSTETAYKIVNEGLVDKLTSEILIKLQETKAYAKTDELEMSCSKKM